MYEISHDGSVGANLSILLKIIFWCSLEQEDQHSIFLGLVKSQKWKTSNVISKHFNTGYSGYV